MQRMGQANGAQITLEKVALKLSMQPEIAAAGDDEQQEQAKLITLQHDTAMTKLSLKRFLSSQKTTRLMQRLFQARGKEQEALKVKASQLPAAVSDATMGHKLQGSSVDALFVHCWSGVRNWDYVMLSHVRARSGSLFRREPLSKKGLKRHDAPEALQRMMDKFRQQSPTYWSEEQHNEIFECDSDNSE